MCAEGALGTYSQQVHRVSWCGQVQVRTQGGAGMVWQGWVQCTASGHGGWEEEDSVVCPLRACIMIASLLQMRLS